MNLQPAGARVDEVDDPPRLASTTSVVVAADHRCQLALVPPCRGSPRGRGRLAAPARALRARPRSSRRPRSSAGRHGAGAAADCLRSAGRASGDSSSTWGRALRAEGCRVLFVERGKERAPRASRSSSPSAAPLESGSRLIAPLVNMITGPRSSPRTRKRTSRSAAASARWASSSTIASGGRARGRRRGRQQRRRGRSGRRRGRLVGRRRRHPSPATELGEHAPHGHSGGAPPSGQLCPHATVKPSSAARSTASAQRRLADPGRSPYDDQRLPPARAAQMPQRSGPARVAPDEVAGRAGPISSHHRTLGAGSPGGPRHSPGRRPRRHSRARRHQHDHHRSPSTTC